MIFCMKINIKGFYKLVFLVIARHTQSTQNSKFVISLQYLKKGGMKLIFRMQINIKLSHKLIPLILVGMVRPAQITQNSKFAKSLLYLKKEVRDEVDFLCRWASFSINWCNHFWWVWPEMPKVLKITSIQCLCNISKNWVMKLVFCMVINMKVFYKLTLLFFMGLTRHALSSRVNF